jgi:hypothetical protein
MIALHNITTGFSKLTKAAIGIGIGIAIAIAIEYLESYICSTSYRRNILILVLGKTGQSSTGNNFLFVFS